MKTYPQHLAEVSGDDVLAGINILTKYHFAEKELLLIPSTMFP